jgi:hypothetical protein
MVKSRIDHKERVMAKREKRCRDCKKCTERGIAGFTKKLANTTMIVGTLGTSAVGAKAIRGMRQNCPICGHPISMHEIVDGRFKD